MEVVEGRRRRRRRREGGASIQGGRELRKCRLRKRELKTEKCWQRARTPRKAGGAEKASGGNTGEERGGCDERFLDKKGRHQQPRKVLQK